MCIYQIGTVFTTGAFGIGTVAAILFVIAFIWLLVRPKKESGQLKMNVNVAKMK